MTTVVQFPKDKIIRDTVNNEVLKQAKDRSVMNFADSLTHEIAENILCEFDNNGIDTDAEAFNKDFHFIIAILAATIYRTMGIDHGLQKFLDEAVVMTEESKEESKIDLTE